MSALPVQSEADFRTAVEARDFMRAEAALRDYIEWFKSATRSAPEIASARDLIEWGIGAATAQRMRMAEDLMRLKNVLDAYLPGKPAQTWRFIG